MKRVRRGSGDSTNPRMTTKAPILILLGLTTSIMFVPAQTTPGTASTYVWFGAPGQSQYFVPYDLVGNTLGSTVRLPYVPNSMVMDRLGTNIYFGSSHALMVYSTA